MRWTDCAEQDLKNYQATIDNAENIKERIKMLELDYRSISGNATDRIRVDGGGGSYEEFLVDNIAERERLAVLHTAEIRMASIIERGLSVLNETEQKVLDRFFIHKFPKHVNILIEELNLEQAQIYRIKDQALYKFTVEMYGIAEY